MGQAEGEHIQIGKVGLVLQVCPVRLNLVRRHLAREEILVLALVSWSCTIIDLVSAKGKAAGLVNLSRAHRLLKRRNDLIYKQEIIRQRV
jgi:hypothetical protein